MMLTLWLLPFLEVVLLGYAVYLFQCLLCTVCLYNFFFIRVNYLENKDDCRGCFSHVKHGAALAG